MRIALVTPYSWTYQGGVNRHVQSLAEEYISRGHYVRVIAPFDPPDRLSKVLHRAPAEDREIPDYLIPIGRTVGINSNGSVSNIPVFPSGVTRTRRAIEEGNFDVVHLHEPMTPVNGWDTCLSSDVPVVGTFHAYSTKPMPNLIANACRFPAGAEQAFGPDRGLRSRRLDRASLVRRQLHDRPERSGHRLRPRRTEARTRPSSGPVRRPGR